MLTGGGRPRRAATSSPALVGARFMAGTLFAVLCPSLLSAVAAADPGFPGPGSALADVRAWIDAGWPVSDPNSDRPADPTTVAFVSPSRKIRCSTGGFHRNNDPSPLHGLTCRIDLEHPRPAPSEAPATGRLPWFPGWVDYGNALLNVGEFHSDCGVFCSGDGPTLPDGDTISFADHDAAFACRMDQSGLWCANTTGGSAARLDDQGVGVYGCLESVRPAYSTGQTYACR